MDEVPVDRYERRKHLLWLGTLRLSIAVVLILAGAGLSQVEFPLVDWVLRVLLLSGATLGGLGLADLCERKGQDRWYGLLVLTGLIGLVVVLAMRDLNGD